MTGEPVLGGDPGQVTGGMVQCGLVADEMVFGRTSDAGATEWTLR